jgi:hypothetical protein
MNTVSMNLVAEARQKRMEKMRRGEVTPNTLASNARRLRLRKDYEAAQKKAQSEGNCKNEIW